MTASLISRSFKVSSLDGSPADTLLEYRIFWKDRIQFDCHGCTDLFVVHISHLPFKIIDSFIIDAHSLKNVKNAGGSFY